MDEQLLDGVRQAAELAKLDLTEAESESLVSQVAMMLSYVRILDDLDLENIEGTSHVRTFAQPLRDDKVVQGMTKPDGLRNSPAGDEDFFIVPGIMSED